MRGRPTLGRMFDIRPVGYVIGLLGQQYRENGHDRAGAARADPGFVCQTVEIRPVLRPVARPDDARGGAFMHQAIDRGPGQPAWISVAKNRGSMLAVSKVGPEVSTEIASCECRLS